MSELETLLHASCELAGLRKTIAHANMALEQALDRLTDVQHENDRLRKGILARDLIIQQLRTQLDAQTPALLRPQI